ncbi:UDP-N-acetylmuramoyl-tripeptide--D-alanyl-D-alanine ligase [Candidatus Microgenomates bacterium]|nr:UDP-N-acetylmuramoyl-tripeptide--D-alanyl-D-alanine ligase [Candidatus Microgenomates bacterium]
MKNNKNIPAILHWWVGNKLPAIRIMEQMNPVKKWFFHPIKRRVAKYYLVFLQKVFGLQVIGITGSVGKTTTKEMIASVISQKYRVCATYANIDPVYNIPTTILRCSPRTRVLVLEMGIEFPGEMDFYLWLVTPFIGIITTIYWTHTQFLENIEGVAKEKGKLIRGLSKNAWAVLNADDSRVAKFKDSTSAKTLLYGTKSTAKIRATNVKLTPELKTKFDLEMHGPAEGITLSLLGDHWIYSALAAAACGQIFNIPNAKIKTGLERVKPQTYRMVPLITKMGAILINDTYNSSPLGAMAAINALTKVGKGKKKIAVLGDMLELGDYEKTGHKEVGQWAAKNGVDVLVCIGNLAEIMAEGALHGGLDKKSVLTFKKAEDATYDIAKLIDKNSVVLFKASRRLKFEELVDHFKKF